jgi:hypothetical protein
MFQRTGMLKCKETEGDAVHAINISKILLFRDETMG